MARCKVDPVYWFNTWVWTYDPRRDTCKRLPMILFPRQEAYIWWRRDRYAVRESFLTEKSRDVGLTWMNAGDQLHHWLYDEAFKGTFGSRKEALVDRSGDPDSIFAKLRFILEYLPGWMIPKGFNRKIHDNFLRLANPANGSTITGEAGDNMGRGGRSSIYDCDEWAFVERANTVAAAISANSDCIGYTSTANGQGNSFHTMRVSGKIQVFTFNWRDDPRKDDAWYQKQVDTLDPITVAQEIDIDYSASVEGILIPRAWVDEALKRAIYDGERGAITIGADIAEAGRDKSAAVVREGRNILHAEEWHDPEAMLSAGKLIAMGVEHEKRLKPYERLYFFIDTLGVGAGTAGDLRTYKRDHGKEQWTIVGVKVSEASTEELCHKLRDALWWRVRRWFKEQEPAVSKVILDGVRNKLATECSTPTYGLNNSSGLIQVESKKNMKVRQVPSPNLADALMHTFYWEAMKPKEESEFERMMRQRREDGGTWMGR